MPPIIDLTYAAEERPDARLRAPVVEIGTGRRSETPAVHVIAHPAAIALALFLRRLHAQRSDSPLGDPDLRAGQRARHGRRATNCSSRPSACSPSRACRRTIFDAQLSFNLLARYGEEAPGAARRVGTAHRAAPGHAAGAARRRRRRADAVAATDSGAGVSRLQLLGVGGIRRNPGHGGARKRRSRSDRIDVRGAISSRPTMSGRRDRAASRWARSRRTATIRKPCWFWMVADNLRLAAENAVAVARQLV